MPKFRKKPVVIEAIQFVGKESFPAILDWTNFAVAATGRKTEDGQWYPVVEIETLEGTVTASPGDWIIRGVKGELYPCKPDIFEQTYELAE